MIDGPALLTTYRDNPSPTIILHTTSFLCVVTKQSLRWCRPEKRGPVTLTPHLPLRTAWLLSSRGPGSQRATCLCHPLEIQQQEHLPFLHAALEAFTSCEAILSPRGVAEPPGLKMLIQACPFFSWKIIRPSAFKESVHHIFSEVLTDHWQKEWAILSNCT